MSFPIFMLNQDVDFCQNKHWKNLLITNVRCLSPFSWKNQGTSRSSILGEADVNLAEFAEALKPASIALPLRGSDSGMLLHVWILENVSFAIIVIIEKKLVLLYGENHFNSFVLFFVDIVAVFSLMWFFDQTISDHGTTSHYKNWFQVCSPCNNIFILHKKLLVLSF